MKNIGFLVPKVHNKGGVARVVSIITNELYKLSKFNLVIIGYTEGDKEGYDWNDNLTYHKLFEKDISLTKSIISGTVKLRKIISKEKLDILVSCDSNLSLLGFSSSCFKKTQLIYWDHMNFYENSTHKLKKESKYLMSQFADVVVVLTKKDQLNWLNNTKTRNVVQIYNPVDRDDKIRLSYNAKTNRILSVGRLSYQKNFELIPQIAYKLKIENENFQWHIYGSGSRRELIENEIKKYNVSDVVKLKGHHNNIKSIYNQYSIMAMTSRYEGLPMVLLEALENKIPAISFDINTGPNEIIIDEKNGYLVKEGDINTYVSKLINMLNNQQLMQDFSLHTYESLKKFNKNDIVNQWIKVLSEL